MPVARDARMLADMVKRLKNRDADPLRPLIDEYLLVRDTPAAKGRVWSHSISMVPRRRPAGRLSPSAVYSCERAAVFKFTGVAGKRRINVDQELLFEDGNWRHHKWQAIFYDMEAVLGRDRFRVLSIEEAVMLPELYVAGSLDVLIAIRMPSGKWRKYVIDIKGINDRGFSWINREDAPKTDNVRQILLYMKAKGVSRGLLLYDNKDKNLTKTFQVGFDSEHWAETLEWIDRVVKAMERKRLPGMHPDCQVGRMMYDSCPFTSLCYGTKDPVDLQELAYDDSWEGVDVAWQRALEELAA